MNILFVYGLKIEYMRKTVMFFNFYSISLLVETILIIQLFLHIVSHGIEHAILFFYFEILLFCFL